MFSKSLKSVSTSNFALLFVSFTLGSLKTNQQTQAMNQDAAVCTTETVTVSYYKKVIYKIKSRVEEKHDNWSAACWQI